jgi:hypothetical protein
MYLELHVNFKAAESKTTSGPFQYHETSPTQPWVSVPHRRSGTACMQIVMEYPYNGFIPMSLILGSLADESHHIWIHFLSHLVS